MGERIYQLCHQDIESEDTIAVLLFFMKGYHCLSKHGDGLFLKVMLCEDQRFLGLLLLEIKIQREAVKENNTSTITHPQKPSQLSLAPSLLMLQVI